MRRSEHHSAAAGIWEAVSGRIELGEEPLEALAREVFEETGLRVGMDVEADLRPLHCYQTLRKTEPMVMIVYRLDYRSGSIERSCEHDEHEWLEPEVFIVRCKHLDKLNPVVLGLASE
jgi:8-oxo-dGTP diphosphatase